MNIWSFFKQIFWLDKVQQIRLPKMVASCSGGGSVGRAGASVRGITFPRLRVQAAAGGRTLATEMLHWGCTPSGFAQTASNLLVILQISARREILPCLCSTSLRPWAAPWTLVEIVTVHGLTLLCVLPGSWIKQGTILSVRVFKRFLSVLLGKLAASVVNSG